MHAHVRHLDDHLLTAHVALKPCESNEKVVLVSTLRFAMKVYFLDRRPNQAQTVSVLMTNAFFAVQRGPLAGEAVGHDAQ